MWIFIEGEENVVIVCESFKSEKDEGEVRDNKVGYNKAKVNMNVMYLGLW